MESPDAGSDKRSHAYPAVFCKYVRGLGSTAEYFRVGSASEHPGFSLEITILMQLCQQLRPIRVLLPMLGGGMGTVPRRHSAVKQQAVL